MNLVAEHYVRPGSRQLGLFGVAAGVAVILISIAIVQQKVLLLTGIAAVAFAIVFPIEASLGAFAVLVPFDQVLVLGQGEATITWAAGAFAGATLMVYGLVSGRFQLPPRAALYWGLFALWSCASSIWAIDPSRSMQWIPTVAGLFALYIVAVSFRVTRRELSRVVSLAVAGGAVAASVVILQFASHITHVGSTGRPEGRASLVAGNLESDPNYLSFSLLLPFSLAVGGVLSEGSLRERTAQLIALGLTTTAILLTMSRGSLIALSATVLVYLFRFGMRKRILIVVLIAAIPLFFLPDLFYQRMEQASSDRGSARFDIWLAGLEIVKRYPVIGTGLANFPVAYGDVAGYAHVLPHAAHRHLRDAHNIYLHICAEMGVIGLAFFTAAIRSQMKAVTAIFRPSQVFKRLSTLPVHPAFSSRGSYDYFGIAIEAACWGQLVAGFSGDIQWSKPFWFAFILLALLTQTGGESESNKLPLAVQGRQGHREIPRFWQ